MADDVLRTRRMRRAEYCFLCARSVLSVSAAVRCLSSPVYSIENRSDTHFASFMLAIILSKAGLYASTSSSGTIVTR